MAWKITKNRKLNMFFRKKVIKIIDFLELEELGCQMFNNKFIDLHYWKEKFMLKLQQKQ